MKALDMKDKQVTKADGFDSINASEDHDIHYV